MFQSIKIWQIISYYWTSKSLLICFRFSLIFVKFFTVNLCNKALGQESKFLIPVPPQKKNFRVCANLIFYENLKIWSIDPGLKIEFLLKMALFNLTNIPGYMTRNFKVPVVFYFIKVFSNLKACIPILAIVILKKNKKELKSTIFILNYHLLTIKWPFFFTFLWAYTFLLQFELWSELGTCGINLPSTSKIQVVLCFFFQVQVQIRRKYFPITF